MNTEGFRTPVLPRDRTTPAAGASASCRCAVSGLLGEAEQLSRNTGDRTAVLQVCCTQAWLSLLQGEPEQVVTSATPLLDNPESDLFFRLTLRERVARAWIELRDVSSAVTAARDLVESARENGTILFCKGSRPDGLDVSHLPIMSHLWLRRPKAFSFGHSALPSTASADRAPGQDR